MEKEYICQINELRLPLPALQTQQGQYLAEIVKKMLADGQLKEIDPVSENYREEYRIKLKELQKELWADIKNINGERP